MIKTNESEKKSINLLIWSISNFVLPIPFFICSGLFESWSFFTFMVGKDGVLRPDRQFLDDILMFPLYITSIGVLISCVLSIVFSIKKKKDCNVIACVSFSVAGFLIEIFLWIAMTYIGSNF